MPDQKHPSLTPSASIRDLSSASGAVSLDALSSEPLEPTQSLESSELQSSNPAQPKQRNQQAETLAKSELNHSNQAMPPRLPAKSPRQYPSSASLIATKAVNAPWYYPLMIQLAKPVYRLVVWWRYRKATKNGLPAADYQSEVNARFGKSYPAPPLQTAPVNTLTKPLTIWCHAVSLGETNTIAPMLKRLLADGARIWLTNTTQTGFARAEDLFADDIDTQQMVHTFVPTDDKKVVASFLNHLQPDLAMFVETELWANTLAGLASRGIPSVLVNARLSQASFEKYQKHTRLSHSMMQNISMIIAQDSESAKRFRKLGAAAAKIRLAPSLKWTSSQLANVQSDNPHSNHAKVTAKFVKGQSPFAEFASRPVWVAGSTHQQEENLLIQAHTQLIKSAGLQNALLILVPRHPERFDEVATLLDASGLTIHRRSNNEQIEQTTQVYLADTMGELAECYQLGDVAFVGGSLVDVGGHNPIEPASLAKPIIMGSHTQSCYMLVDALQEAGALKVVGADNITGSGNATYQDAVYQTNGSQEQVIRQLCDVLQMWLTDTASANHAGQQGYLQVQKNSQALDTQLDMMMSLLVNE